MNTRVAKVQVQHREMRRAMTGVYRPDEQSTITVDGRDMETGKPVRIHIEITPDRLEIK